MSIHRAFFHNDSIAIDLLEVQQMSVNKLYLTIYPTDNVYAWLNSYDLILNDESISPAP